ncbi:MAG: methylated-DNA--[protein]-cysteine S-methyltransferase [Candidatus Baltobacteraceae bacterium]
MLLHTPLGCRLLVRSNGEAIVASGFSRSLKRSPAVSDPLLREARDQVKAYFRRRLLRFDLPLHFDGAEFECAVWQAVSQLETGELISYSDLARALGKPRAARGVARAMSRSPLALFVPAHRVVGADGTVRGASRASMRRKLLAFEGINLR